APTPQPTQAAPRATEPVPEGTVDVPSAADARARVEETPPANPAEREASVERSSHLDGDQITPQEAANEVAYVDDHPDLVEGEAPNRHARVGDHEIVETPGGCERRSNKIPIPCPDCVQPTTGTAAAEVQLTARQEQMYRGLLARFEQQNLTMAEALE